MASASAEACRWSPPQRQGKEFFFGGLAMIGAYVRKDLTDFAGYYAEDLVAWEGKPDSASLDFKHCQQPSVALIERKIGLKNLMPPTWQALSRATFDQQIDRLRPVAAQERNRVLSLGLTFSPPKSYSLAALAGPVVLPSLLKAQDRAVDFALAVASQFFVARARGELISIPLRAYRFRHFYSRADDPQLHSHVELVWHLAEDSRALDAYPIFFHQFPLRCLYHYQLLAGLAAEGFSVSLGPKKPLAWGLDGIESTVVELFAKRSKMIMDAALRTDHLSLGLALRVEAYRSQQLFPKPLKPIPLSRAREEWSNEIGLRKIRPVGGKLTVPGPTLPDLWKVFARSSILTETSFCAEALMCCWGQGIDGFAAVKLLDQAVQGPVKAGTLRRGDGRSLCFVEAFRLENELLARIKSGLGRGRPCVLVGGKAGLNMKLEATVALRKDLLRVVTSGRPVPRAVSMEVKGTSEFLKTPPPLLLNIASWDIRLLVAELQNLPETDIMLWVAEPVHAGDFACFAEALASPPSVRKLLRKTYTMSLRKGKPRTKVEINAGEIPRDAAKKFPRLEKRLVIDQLAIALVADDYPENVRRELNIRIIKDWVLSLPWNHPGPLLEWDEVIRMEEVDLSGNGMRLPWVAIGENPFVGIGCRVSYEGVSEIGEAIFRRKNGKRLALSWDSLSEQLSIFVHLKPYPVRPIRGLQIEATLPYPLATQAGHHLIQEGEIVEIAGWTDDKSLILSDGRCLPPTCRTLLPAYVRRNLDGLKNPPDAVILEDTLQGELLKRLRDSSLAKKIVVLSSRPKRSALKIASALRQEKIESLSRKLNSFRLGGGINPIIPQREVWENAILQTEPAIVVPGVPGRPKKLAVEEEEEKITNTPVLSADPPHTVAQPDQVGKPAKPPSRKRDKLTLDPEQEK